MSAIDEKVAVPELPVKSQTSNSSIDEKHANELDQGSVSVAGAEVAKSRGADVVAGLLSGHAEDAEVDPALARRIRAKLDWRMLPLLFLLYTLQFLDKNTLASSNVLGILADAHLTTDDFNNLATSFYAGYIVFVLPHAWAMQRFPIAKYISANIMLWGLLTGVQAACKSYGSLFACRFLLGGSESCITTGVMTLIQMFYTRLEITERVGWTFQCNGLAAIIGGFIAFGVAHIKLTVHPHRWQWFMIIMAILSVITSLLWFFLMPDNPTSAKFLTEEERIFAVQRIRVNQNGIESKVWKKYQFIEAFTDVKTWILFLFAIIAELQGGIGVEYGAIIKGFGFNTTQTTLLNIPSGFAMIIAITLGGILLRRFPNSRTILGCIGFIPGIIACFFLLFLPMSNRAGLIVQIYLINMGGLGLTMVVSLCTISFAGHTKKMTANAIFFVGYAVGQMLNSQFWKVQYRPRNTVPWVIILVSLVLDIVLVLALRFVLVAENRRRDAEKLASGKEYDEFGYIETTGADGQTHKVKVPIQFLDITDKENKAFRYAI
ncbi:hypothetical protein FRB93_008300 [Tulasnella sp. JGI-2019a]|nr:hypothetical protein FRB93_008300 [Tulasnella sp. JGI-2019a]